MTMYEEIKQKGDIRKVLEYYGLNIHNSKCECPNPEHADHNPSLSVSARYNMCKCFACGYGGNVVTIVPKLERDLKNNPNVSFLDALKKVNEICNLGYTFKEDNEQSKQHRDVRETKYSKEQIALMDINNQLSRIFEYSAEYDKETQDYIKQRGITEDIQKKLHIGSTRNLKLDNELMQSMLKQAGMMREDGTFTFNDRLLFPITDEYGNILGFSGRTMKNETPKYLFTSGIKKAEILYNLQNAKKKAYKRDLMIVEGYMDVVGAMKKGYENVVACMGTQLSNEQVSLIKRTKCSVTLALDNDSAGEENMIKRIEELRKQNVSVSVVDIGKLDESLKDFGDIGNTEYTKLDVMKATVTDIEYQLCHKFMQEQHIPFRNNEKINASMVSNLYNYMDGDGYILDTEDREKFIEAITPYSFSDVRQLIAKEDINLFRKEHYESSIENIQKKTTEFDDALDYYWNNFESKFAELYPDEDGFDNDEEIEPPKIKIGL